MLVSFDIGLKNLAYCALDADLNISEWKVINILAKDIYSICDELLQQLEIIRSNFIAIDTVLIENQPCMKNPTMKSIQMMIFTYFKMHRKNVVLISACNKIKVSKNDNPKEKLSYSQKKKKSIELTRLYIDGTKHQRILEAEKKKDDLADCFLQAVYYFEHNIKE